MKDTCRYHNVRIMDSWLTNERRKMFNFYQNRSWWQAFKDKLNGFKYKFDPPQINLQKYARGLCDLTETYHRNDEFLEVWNASILDIKERVEAECGIAHRYSEALTYVQRRQSALRRENEYPYL